MTSSLTDIEDALKRTIAQTDLNVYETVPDISNSPAAVVELYETNYGTAMRMGGDTYYFTIYILVANKITREAQRKLNQYITGQGPKSLREYLFRNPTLGLPDVDANAERIVRHSLQGSAVHDITIGTTHFVGAALRVCVTVT